MRDALTEIPDRDTYWLPVRLSDELLLEELEEVILSAAGNREFISYRDINAFDLGFDGLMEKLKLYYESNPPGVGKVAGLKLIRRLEELETGTQGDGPSVQGCTKGPSPCVPARHGGHRGAFGPLSGCSPCECLGRYSAFLGL